VVEEYFFPEDLTAYNEQPDPFYQSVKSADGAVHARLSLPVEYDEWLAIQPTQVDDRTLRIISPQERDIFVLDQGQSGKVAQRLEFRLANPLSAPAEWRLNGKLLATQQASTLLWEPSPGSWHLQVKSGGAIAQVRFEVQVAENRPNRRGFSFTKG